MPPVKQAPQKKATVATPANKPKVNGAKPAQASPNSKNLQQAVETFENGEPEGGRPILYAKPQVRLCLEADGSQITFAVCKKLLRWEAEKDYVARMCKDNPKLKQEEVGYGNDFLLKDEEGQKVRCWANTRNRPFDDSWARQLAQDILNRVFKFNMENIIISLHGEVISGQHRLVGLALACQIWAGKNGGRWKGKWPVEPFIESSIGFGAPDNPEVLRTYDNVKPRTLADVFYTSEIFRELTSVERKECSRMLQRAVDLLWKRTGAGTGADSTNKYQSHSTSMEFLDRHGSLLKCLHKMLEFNRERAISVLKMSPGECAGLLYMMGSSSSDGDVYRNSDPLTEKSLSWDNYDLACEYWEGLAKKLDKFEPLRIALGSLVDEDTGTGGRRVEKYAVLAKAWGLFAGGEDISEETLNLPGMYHTDEKGVVRLIECPDFGGIDIGEKKTKKDAPDPTPGEIAKAAEEKRQQIATQSEENVRKFQEAQAAKETQGSTPSGSAAGKPVTGKPGAKPAGKPGK